MKTDILEVLSVHTTNKCSVGCPFCYLDKSNLSEEKPHEWWIEFFKSIDNVKQIALAWNDQDIKEISEYIKLVNLKDIIINLTSNPKNISEYNAKILSASGITMVSLSVDRFKCQNINDVKEKIEILKLENILTGINLLLDNDIVLNLEAVVQRLLNMGADIVYALHPKPNTLDVTLETLSSQLMSCSFLFANRFAVDESSKLRIGKSLTCKRGNELLSVNSCGEICLCSFDKPYKLYTGKIVPVETITNQCPFL
ncbi:MAG: hypothetical protein AB1782_15200 [Cyanobacteriota bacterium]